MVVNSCLICNNHEADVVYIPCGHKSACYHCCVNAPRCPFCDALAEEKVQERDGFGMTTFVVSLACSFCVFGGLSAMVIMGATKGFLDVSIRSSIILVIIFSLFLGISIGICWQLKRISRQVSSPLKPEEDLP